MQALNPRLIAAPFGRYSHGVAVPVSGRLVLTSGQLGVRPDGSLPEGALDQARQCFANCAAILAEAGLSYVGLGAQPPTPSWGRMLAEAQTMFALAPHVAIVPGLAIVLTVLGLNLLGDGLRDALDPRLRRRSLP